MITQKFLLVPIIALMIVPLAGCSSVLVPVERISHAHGMAVDVADSSKLYIASHNGLLLLKNEKDLYRIGNIQDDFMGFSAHPEKPETFFTSGHPQKGGNLGIQRSDDGGISWKKLSDGVSGPVDFHSMTLSPANPNILYGWYGALQRSRNTGKNWELVPASIKNVISLTADPHDENVVYAGTTNGLYFSKDQGGTWSIFTEDLASGEVTSLAIDPSNGQNMLSFSEALGLAKSTDGGVNWESASKNLGIILYFAFDTNAPNNVYALNRENEIYKSINGGDTWNRVR